MPKTVHNHPISLKLGSLAAACALAAALSGYSNVALGSGGTNGLNPSEPVVPVPCVNPVYADSKYDVAKGVSDGSISKPWVTPAQIQAAIKADSCVRLRGGVYVLPTSINLNKSNVTLMGEPGERVYLTNARKVPEAKWAVHSTLSNNVRVYKTEIGLNPIDDVLNEDFVLQTPAHFPEEGWMPLTGLVSRGLGTFSYTIRNQNLAALGDLSGATLISKFNSQNATAVVRIKTSGAGQSGEIELDPTTVVLNSSDRYVLSNTLATIKAGQWAMKWNATKNTHELYYATSVPAQLGNLYLANYTGKIAVKVSGGASNVRIHNLIISGTGWGVNVSDASDVKIERNIFSNLSQGVYVRYGNMAAYIPRNITIKGNIFYHTVGLASMNVITAADNLKITQNEFAFSRGDQIQMTGQFRGVEVSRNYIHHHNQQFTHADGFQLFASSTANTPAAKNINIHSNLFWIGGQHTGCAIADSPCNFENNIFLNSIGYSKLPSTLPTSLQDYSTLRNTFALQALGPFNTMANSRYYFTDNVFSSTNKRINFAYLERSANASVLAGSDFNLFHLGSLTDTYFAKAFGSTFTHMFRGTNGLDPIRQQLGTERSSRLVVGSIFGNMPEVMSPLLDSELVNATRSRVVIQTRVGFNVGDYVEINGDRIKRLITALEPLGGAAAITFTPALPMKPFSGDTVVDNWGPIKSRSVSRDSTIVHPEMQRISSTGGRPGSNLSMYWMQRGYFDGGIYPHVAGRSIPELPIPMVRQFTPNTFVGYPVRGPKPQ